MVYPVHRPQAATVLVVMLWCIGAAALVMWFPSHRVSADTSNWRDWLAATALLASAAGTVSFCKTGDQGQLVWDGEFWHREGVASIWRRKFRILGLFDQMTDGANTQVQVVFDVQAAMLLRLTRGQCAPQWMWVTRSAHPERWLDLRRAVYSPIRHTVLDGETAWNAPNAKARPL